MTFLSGIGLTIRALQTVKLCGMYLDKLRSS